MTVAELIEELKKYPENLKVRMDCAGDGIIPSQDITGSELYQNTVYLQDDLSEGE